MIAVADNVGYLQLDVWNVTVQDVYRVNRGAAYDLGQRTIYADELSHIPLDYDTFEPNTDPATYSGQCLVIALDVNATMGEQISV